MTDLFVICSLQSLLDAVTVLKTKSSSSGDSSKYIHRVSFSPIGTESNAYMNNVILMTQKGVDPAHERSGKAKKDKIWVLRAGEVCILYCIILYYLILYRYT